MTGRPGSIEERTKGVLIGTHSHKLLKLLALHAVGELALLIGVETIDTWLAVIFHISIAPSIARKIARKMVINWKS